ncbi:MAG: gliding motility-associated C-terminal domain-containing protein, partial [Saprospiraceae bacterium]|nr:gliding motility-associated C-terminal domain-containing protein [Saprospiraceae bacterium]
NTDFQTSPVFQSVEAGMYTIYVRDGHGCMVEKTTEVIQSPALEVTFPDILILPCDSQKVSLTPIISGDTTNLQMLWWNGAHTSTISTEETGPIWIEVANQCETIRREGEVVWADSDGNPVLVFIPNVFEPAATLTENQIFRPFFSKNLSLLSYRLEVFDRWGNFIFESEIPENGWQGKFGDTNTGTEVFVWQMWAQVSFCGRQIGIYKKGDVTVVR